MTTKKRQQIGRFSVPDGIEPAKFKRLSMVLDELVWSIKKSRPEDLEEIARLLRDMASFESQPQGRLFATPKHRDPNKHFLIGALPGFLQNRELFPQNEDIIDFANAALRLQMSRSGKRSRYEIIGNVICETESLDGDQLTDLVAALDKVVGNKERLAEVASKKNSKSFSWNETIQQLLKG